MVIIGENIIIRAIEREDAELLRSLINDPDTEKMLGGSSWPVSKAEQTQWIEGQFGNHPEIRRGIITLKHDNQAIGTVILSNIDQKNGTAEIHIKISKDGYRGKGLGADAIRTVVQYAFNEMRLNCIYALILANNETSRKLFEKCGFMQEGLLKERIFKGGHYLDQLSYAIIRNK